MMSVDPFPFISAITSPSCLFRTCRGHPKPPLWPLLAITTDPTQQTLRANFELIAAVLIQTLRFVSRHARGTLSVIGRRQLVVERAPGRSACLFRVAS